MTLRRMFVAAATALLAVGVAATPAFAHARLLHSDPAPGSTVGAGLAKISLEFDDTVKLLPRALIVTGATGAPLTTGAPHVVGGRVLEVALLDHPVAGRYYVGWRILADDGHVESGSFGFSVGTAAAAPAADSSPPPAQPTWPVVVAAVLAGVAVLGAALVVQRGLRAVRQTPVDAYPNLPDRPRRHESSPFDDTPLRH